MSDKIQKAREALKRLAVYGMGKVESAAAVADALDEAEANAKEKEHWLEQCRKVTADYKANAKRVAELEKDFAAGQRIRGTQHAEIARLKEALEAIAEGDALWEANEEAFSKYAARRMKAQARAALAPPEAKPAERLVNDGVGVLLSCLPELQSKLAEPAKCVDPFHERTCPGKGGTCNNPNFPGEPPPAPEAAPVEFANRCETCQGVIPLCADCCDDLRAQLAAAQARADVLLKENELLVAEAEAREDKLEAANARADKAEGDLKAYLADTAVTCAFCEARHERPVTFEDIKAHVLECPKHPLSVTRRDLAEAMELLRQTKQLVWKERDAFLARLSAAKAGGK